MRSPDHKVVELMVAERGACQNVNFFYKIKRGEGRRGGRGEERGEK